MEKRLNKKKKVLKTVMETCEAIMEFDYVEAYLDYVEAYLDSLSLFKTICANFPKSLEYVGGIILGPMRRN